MNGRQLAGWGYGFFWLGLLCELVNAIVAAQTSAPLQVPAFWAGVIVAFGFVGVGIGMMLQIRHRPW